MQDNMDFLFIWLFKGICGIQLNIASLGIDEGRAVSEVSGRNMKCKFFLLSLFSMMLLSHIDTWITVRKSNSHMNQKIIEGDVIKY